MKQILDMGSVILSRLYAHYTIDNKKSSINGTLRYCPFCGITAERELISSEHKEKCHKFPIACPNNCGLGDIPRDCMEEHKKVCPLEIVQCEYGCGAIMARSKIMEHDRERFLTHIRIFKRELDRSIQKTNLVNRFAEAERKVAIKCY